MRTAELYDNPEYSDLTIRLSDGSDIHVHKVIICTQSTALRRLCQVSQPCGEFPNEAILTKKFSQNNLSVLELGDDDALAVEALIRHLHKCKFDGRKRSWGFWLEVRAVAKKHDQKSLMSTASAKIGRIVLQLFRNEDGELLPVMAVIEQDHTDDACLSKIVKRLRQEPKFH
ncbi:hypothetical protein Q7P35_003353 [Cladosporium inversicolor]